MFITADDRKKICEYILREGYCYAKEDGALLKHPNIDVPNGQVLQLFKMFESKGYVTQTVASIWSLTDDGVKYVKTWLNSPFEDVPGSLERPVGCTSGLADRLRGMLDFQGDQARNRKGEGALAYLKPSALELSADAYFQISLWLDKPEDIAKLLVLNKTARAAVNNDDVWSRMFGLVYNISDADLKSMRINASWSQVFSKNYKCHFPVSQPLSSLYKSSFGFPIFSGSLRLSCQQKSLTINSVAPGMWLVKFIRVDSGFYFPSLMMEIVHCEAPVTVLAGVFELVHDGMEEKHLAAHYNSVTVSAGGYLRWKNEVVPMEVSDEDFTWGFVDYDRVESVFSWFPVFFQPPSAEEIMCFGRGNLNRQGLVSYAVERMNNPEGKVVSVRVTLSVVSSND